MFELGEEQGQMMQVLMRHCQTMKRQETRLRLATAVLLATFLATLLWLQFNQQTTKVIYKTKLHDFDYFVVNSHYHSDVIKRGDVENCLCM